MKNKIFKKSISLVLTVLMVMSSWVFFPGMIPEAEAAATQVNVTTSFTLSPNGNRGATDWTRLALTGESSAAGTSVVLFRFTNADLKKLADKDEINLQFYAYSCTDRLTHKAGVAVNADIYYITQNATFVSSQGTNKSTNVADTGNSVLGTDCTYSYAQDKAKSYFGLSDTTLVGSFEQPNINGQGDASLRTGDANYSYPVTDIVKQKAASGEDLSFIVMLRQGYSCSGDRGWSDVYINSDTIALSGYNMLEELKSKIEAYEGYFSDGTFYTNLANNYNAYNDAKRYYDAVTYGGVQFNAITAQNYMNAIDTAIANTGRNDTYVDYLNANITSRDGSTVSAAYRKNVIWYPWDFSWDITSNDARPTIQDTYFYFTMPNTIVGITSDSETTFPLHSFFWTATGSRYVRYVIAGSGTISSGVVGSSDFSTMEPWKISDNNNTHTTSGLNPGTDGFGGWVFEKNYRTDVSLKNEENNSNNFSYSQSTVYQISSYAQINKSSIGVDASNTYKKVDQGFTFATSNRANNGTTNYGNHYASNYSNYGGALHVVYMDTYKNNYQNWKTLIPAISYKDYNGFVYSDATNVTKHLDYASEIPLNLNLTEANRVGDISSTVTVWAQNINKGANDLANAKAAGTTRVTNKYVDLINAITNSEADYADGSAKYTYASWNAFKDAYDAAKAHMASLNPAGSNVQYSSDATAIGNLATALNNARNALEVRTYDVTYENMFSFSSWANSASSVVGTPNKGTMTYDVNAGTITVNNNDANTQPNPNDHYSSYGFGNGHYNMTLVPGETYTFEYTTSGGSGDQVHIFFYDDSGNAVANPANRGSAFAHAYGSGRGKSTISFTAPENATKAAFRFGSTVLGDSITFSNIYMYSHTRGDYADIAHWTERPNRDVFTYGQDLGTKLDVPERPGYNFEGWWVDSINPNGQKDEGEQVTDDNGTVVTNLQNFGIAQDWVLYSEWTPIMYTVTWENEDGTVLETDENITYGTTPSYDRETPTKAADAQYTYTFKGWSPEVTEVTGHVTYTATYDKTPNSVTVTWKFTDGTEITESYTYGTTPTAPQNTASFNDAAGHHTYSWPTIGAVTSNVTYEEIEKTDAHNYNQQVATDAYKATDATCTAKATYYYSCSCGTKGTTTFEYGELAAHTPGAEATCTAPQTCTVCGAELAPQLAHTYDKQIATDAYKATDATCTAKATYYYSCSCGAKGTTTFEYGEKLAHSLGNWITDKEPTCITAGSKHKECANCDYTETEAIAATGVHVYGDWAQFINGTTHRRTCTADENCTAFEEEAHNFNGALRQMDNGNYHQYKCEKCDAYGVGTQMNVGEACFGEGTTFTQIADNANQHKETCKCGRVQNDAHNYGDWVADPENKADDKGQMSRTCSECSYKQTTSCNYKATETVNATCTEDGHITWECSDCGNGYTQIIPEKGHTAGEAVTENNVPATCTTDGSYDSVVYCTVCNAELNREKVTVTAEGHKFGETVTAKAATCIATGNEAYKQCTVCNKYFAADEDAMSTDAKDSAEAFKTEIDSNNHENTTSHEQTNATCLDIGYTAGMFCEDCDKWISGHEEIPEIAHKNKEHHEKVDATCVATGTIEYWSCPDCGKNFSDEACATEVTDLTIEIAPDNHDLKTTAAKAPTCTDIGWNEYVTCQREGCDYTTYKEISAIAHKNKVHHEKVDATCVATGTIEYWSCPDCGKNFSDEACTTEVTELTIGIDADNHDWNNTTYTWTETDDVWTCTASRTCNRNEAHIETDNATVESEVKTPATCEDVGTTTYTATFNVDWATKQTQELNDIEAIGHNYSVEITARPELVNGTWTDGTYTYTCKNDVTHTYTEPAPRADYSELDKLVEELEELLTHEKLTDEGKSSVSKALEKADDLAENLVVSEQPQIDELLNELSRIKTAAENIIANAGKAQPIVEAISGLKVQFLEADDIVAIESLQLNAGGGFDPARLRLTNNNSTLPITVTSVVADKANIESVGAGAVIDIDGAKDLAITAPSSFNETGIITYTITYKIGSDATGYLMDENGTAVVFTTEAYIYVKGAAYTPYHFMDERAAWPLTATSKWQHYIEAVNYGDFKLISVNSASKFNDNMEVGSSNFGFRHDAYDYAEDGCQAGCTTTTFKTGDAHAATYKYYVDTSLAPTWEAAGFRARITETAESVYENAPLKYVRLVVDQAYLDGISGNDKTFTTTFVPSPSSNAPTKTWVVTSSGTLDVSAYENPDRSEYLFGEHKNKDGFDETSAYANFSGIIPVGVNEAKLMFSPRIEFNGDYSSESVTMTSHIWLTSYDKSALREAVNAAELAAYNPNYYVDTTYKAYQDALANAKEVLGKAETTQAEIDTATETLNNAVDALTRAEYVLTVTDSIHEGADKGSEATKTEISYYLLAKDSTFEVPFDEDAIALEKINKHDSKATLTIKGTTEHTYHYWYIDFSNVQAALDAADALLEKDPWCYTEEYKNELQTARDNLGALDQEKYTSTPQLQSEVDNLINAVNDLVAAEADGSNHAHVKGDLITDKAPTCTENGAGHYDCKYCGIKISDEEIVAEGHKFSGTVTANAATCLADGNEAYKQCTVCNKYFAADADKMSGEAKDSADAFVIAKKAHSYTGEYKWNNAVEPKTHSQKCVNGCEEYGNETECTFEESVTAPTCYVNGYTTYTCTVCNNSYQADYTTRDHIYVYASGNGTSHTVTCEYENCNYTATENCSGGTATCTDKAVCSKCNTAYGDVLGHDWSVTYNFAADGKTCTATRTCANDENHNVTVNATITSVVKTPATCTEKGWTTYTAEFDVDWAEKKTLDVKDIEINANNHVGETYTQDEDIVEGTCISEKTWNEVTYCSDCNAKLSTVAKTGEKNPANHASTETYIKDDKAENCGVAGYTGDTYHKCCNVLKAKGKEIPATGNHTYGSFSHDEGKSTHSKVCSVCGNTVTEDCIAGNWIISLNATCMEKGSRYKECTVCKHEMEREEIPMIAHRYGGDAVNKEDGKHHYQCQNILNTGKQCAEYGNEEVCSGGTATCTDKAVCSKCNTAYGNVLGHDWSVTYDFATDGKTCTATRVCKNDANHVETATATITSAVKTPATCTVDGWTTYTATFDEDWAVEQILDVQDIAAINHNWDKTKSGDNLTRPELVDGTWTKGYYTYTCKNDPLHTTKEEVDRAAYNDYEAAWNALVALQKTDLTTQAKEEIQKVLDDNDIADNLIDSEQNIVDEAEEKLRYTFEQYKGSLNTYTVTFVVDEVETEVTVISGNDATAPTNVTKDYDETYHYKFDKWDSDFTNVTSDITVTATFKAIEHTYTHTDKDDTYHTDSCNCGYSKDVKHTETSEVTTKASCYGDGVRTYTCSVCSGTRTETIAKREHVYVDNGVKTAATCKAEGVMNTICSNVETDTHTACTHESTRVIPVDPNAHKAEADYTVMQKATCEADGYKAILCEYCDAELSKETIAKREHNLVDTTVATAPTCSATGIMNQKCDHAGSDEYEACGYTTTRVMDKVADAHKAEADYTVMQKATCEADGYKAILCEYCDAELSKEIIAKREHVYVDNGVKTAATCKAEGVMNTICSNVETDTHAACTHESTRVIPVDPNAHKAEAEYIQTIAPTCSAVGEEKLYCEYCDAVLDTREVAIDKDAHKAEAEYIQTIAPTCSAVGEEKLYCEYCDAVLDTREVAIDKDAHTGAANVIKNAKEATCLENGYTGDIHWSCCDALETKGTEIPAPGHTEATREENRVEPSCGAAGSYDLVTYCTVCTEAINTEKVGIPATGEHNFVTEVDGTRVPSTCKTPGSVTMKCGCGATEVQTIPVDENNHENIVTDGAVAPTCTKSGLTEGSHCAACDKVIIKQEEIPAIGHKEDKDASIYIAPSCDKNGYVKRVCGVCGEIFGSSTIAPTGHKYTDETGAENFVIVPATCDAKGSKYLVCTVCGYENTKDAVPYGTPSGHYLFIKEGYAPTCTEDGLTEYVYCLREGCNYEVHAKKIPATGHKDNGDGMCSSCGNKLYEGGSKSCGCLCHKDSVIMRFIYKIVLFFWKLFRIKHGCGCGSIHY